MNKQDKFSAIYCNHINGNCNDANRELNKLNKADLVDFITFLADSENDKLRKVSTWDTGNGKLLRLVTVN